jgi:hypothetical protein
MTEQQAAHVHRLNETFKLLNTEKYRAGCKEHKSFLWEIDTLDLLYNLRDEALDSFNYVQSAIDSIEGKFPNE